MWWVSLLLITADLTQAARTSSSPASYKKCFHIHRTDVKCLGDSLGGIPQDLPRDTTQLHIKDDDFGVNGWSALPYLPQLNKLTLTNVAIKHIPDEAFINTPALKHLNIYHENIEAISETAFHGLPNLERVRLVKAGLTQLPDFIFKHSKGLKQIYLPDNNLTEVSGDVFKPLTRVEQLVLTGNKISKVEAGAFDCIDRGSRRALVHINKNLLKSWEPDLFDGVKRWFVYDNPIVCDCKLKIKANFMDTRAKCSNEEYKGTLVQSLFGKELQCNAKCELPQIKNGAPVQTEPLSMGERLEVKCKTRYHVIRYPGITCQSDGTLSGKTPTCTRIPDVELNMVDDAVVLYTEDFAMYENPATFTCPDNTRLKECWCVEQVCMGVKIEKDSCSVYAVRGTPTRGRITCVAANTVEVAYTFSRNDDVKHYAGCHEDYEIASCVMYNPHKGSSNFGVVEQDRDNICRVDCEGEECELYIRCMKAKKLEDCEKFAIRNAKIHPPFQESVPFKVGETVTVICDEGYKLVSVDVRQKGTVTCVNNNYKYQPTQLPYCVKEKKAECKLNPMPNVLVYPDWTAKEGERITLVCEGGGPKEYLLCEASSSFDKVPSTKCPDKKTKCRLPGVPNGSIKIKETGAVIQSGSLIEENVLVEVVCNDGYQAESKDPIECLDSGVLSRELPICIKEKVKPGCTIPIIMDSTFEGGETPGDIAEPNAVITVRCNKGYELKRGTTDTLTCLTGQYWKPNDKHIPQCEEKDTRCKVPNLPNGYYDGRYFKEIVFSGETINGICSDGYDLVGPRTLDCLEGVWSDGNRCIEPQPCIIPVISNGRVLHKDQKFLPGVKFPIICDNGHELSMPEYNTIKCNSVPKDYEPYDLPKCILPERGCSTKPVPNMVPVMGPVHEGQKITVKCTEGYRLVGSDVITCGRTKQYLEAYPVCMPDSICETPSIANGKIAENPGRYTKNGTQLKVVCDDSFDAHGDIKFSCINGRFNSVPLCLPISGIDNDCKLPILNNGHWQGSSTRLNPGSTLSLVCYSGYEPSHDNDVIKCVTGEKYSSSQLPRCVAVESTAEGCKPLTIENGKFIPQNLIAYYDKAYVSCEKGFAINGETWTEIACRPTGRFDRKPRCEKIRCTEPEIAFADVIFIEAGNHFKVHCHDNYYRKGDQTIYCSLDGTTRPNKDEYPECIKLPGPCILKNPTKYTKNNGGFMGFSSNYSFAQGTELKMYCMQGYEPARFTTKCLGDDVFEDEIPTCKYVGIKCRVPVIKNAIPELTGGKEVKPFETIKVTCKPDYQLSGDSEITCLADGNWSMKQKPSCIKLNNNCSIPIVPNGVYNGPEELFRDDRFSIECNDGYKLVGVQNFLVCHAGDKYSDILPTCEKIDPNAVECRHVNIQGGYYLGSRLAGHSLQIMCKEGYYLRGASKLTCQPNGQYDKPSPECVARDPFDKGRCGMRDQKIWYKIFGGEDAAKGEFPWNVLIYFSRGRFCGGSIIDENWVLTAGHCLAASLSEYCEHDCKILKPSDVLSIKAGVFRKTEKESSWQVRTATEVYVHPYLTMQRKYLDYDIGLIKVNQSFVFNSTVNKICLPKSGVHDLVTNQNLTVSGWGKTNFSSDSSALQKIVIPYVRREICNSKNSYNGLITDRMFCAGLATGGKDACQGDSGGPLIYLGQNGTYIQGGIVSWGQGCALEHYYGVYSNLAYFYEWITEMISEN